jgi:hypothetical protein
MRICYLVMPMLSPAFEKRLDRSRPLSKIDVQKMNTFFLVFFQQLSHRIFVIGPFSL